MHSQVRLKFVAHVFFPKMDGVWMTNSSVAWSKVAVVCISTALFLSKHELSDRGSLQRCMPAGSTGSPEANLRQGEAACGLHAVDEVQHLVVVPLGAQLEHSAPKQVEVPAMPGSAQQRDTTAGAAEA